MSTSVTVVDCGSGNLLSVSRALEHCGASVKVSHHGADIERAERVVLPGVGAFADGMAGLRDRQLLEPIRRFAATGRPLLGICLGMQMLLTSSEEFGHHEGIGLVPGEVLPLPATALDGSRLKRPHIGWADLLASHDAGWAGSPLEGLAQGTSVYLVHSYAAYPSERSDRLAECLYGGNRVVAAIRRENIVGCQFHPEKSGSAGLQVLRRFLGAGSAAGR
ncbi:MAG: imidazole glycerol phosphate synthase subunit HisH [Caldimonas sp.]